MRGKLGLCILWLCCLSNGCTLAGNATRNLVGEASETVDDRLERIENWRTAKQAWKVLREANPYQAYSAPFAQGFKQGYVDQLTTGGRGQLLPIPPQRRRWCHTPEDFQAGEDWLAGFRLGAAAAQEAGYGQVATDPTGQHTGSAMFQHQVLTPQEPASKPVPDTDLPLPRKVSSGPDHTVDRQPMGPW